MWSLSKLYWQRRGARAFVAGEVPYLVNNDGRLDILMAQIAASGTGASAQVQTRPLKNYCKDLTRIRERQRCSIALEKRRLFKFFSKQQPSDILKCKTIKDKGGGGGVGELPEPEELITDAVSELEAAVGELNQVLGLLGNGEPAA